jgi:uncharacterized Zn finger protein (UPF0148 family)
MFISTCPQCLQKILTLNEGDEIKCLICNTVFTLEEDPKEKKDENNEATT